MSEAWTIDLPDEWRATFEPRGEWLCVRLHPPKRTGQWGLADGLWREIDSRGAHQVVLEMDEVEFFPSALMAELVRLHKRVATHNGRLRLCGLQPHPHEALRTVRLDEVMSVHDTREAALQH